MNERNIDLSLFGKSEVELLEMIETRRAELVVEKIFNHPRWAALTQLIIRIGKRLEEFEDDPSE